MNIWLIIVLAGAGTFAIRLSMLVFVHHSALPPLVRDGLRFVMPAVLAAVIFPAVLYVGDGDDLSLGIVSNERILAAALSAAVAWLTRNVWLTIGVGMAALWVLKAVT